MKPHNLIFGLELDIAEEDVKFTYYLGSYMRIYYLGIDISIIIWISIDTVRVVVTFYNTVLRP